MDQDTNLSRDDPARRQLVDEVFLEIRMHQNAQDAFDDLACHQLGINRTDGRCLDILDQNRRMTAGELAKASGLTTGAITTLLDRLERKGYVRRIRDEVDRRRVLVEPTEEARRRTWEIWGPIAEEAGADFARFTDEELIFLRDFLRGGREFLARHTARVRALGSP
jgi:DNA-binding MarR family transcriptional regulator